MQKHHNSVLINSGLNFDVPELKSNGYAIYGEDYCGFTISTRNLLKNSNTPFFYYTFAGNRSARNGFSQRYANGYSTIPMIFQNGQFIGGYNELKVKLAKK